MLIGQKRAYNSSSFLLRAGKIEETKGSMVINRNSNNGVKSIKSSKNIAILASKKNFKTAVLRNKVRRRIKNALNKATSLPQKKQVKQYNLIFSLKKGIEKVDFTDLVDQIKQSLLNNGII